MFLCGSLSLVLVFGVLSTYGGHSATTNNNTSNDPSTIEPKHIEMCREVVELAVPVHKKMNDINDYREIVLPPYSNTRIHLANYTQNAGESVGYALVQLHAFEFKVTLSYNSSIVDGGHLTGQNVGLLMYDEGDLYAINLNAEQPVWIAIVLMLYNQSAPVPGGCNLEFPVAVSPVLNLTLTKEVVVVDTPAASVARKFQSASNGCGHARLQYESYYYQMAAHDFSQAAYFSAIRSLISYANAKTSGHQNTLQAPLQINRHEYGRVIGRGMVFVTVVIDPVHRGYALYVPVHTYSCQPFVDRAQCYGMNIPTFVLAILLAVIAMLEVITGWLPMIVKCPICMAGLSVVLSIEFLDWLGKPMDAEWIIGILLGMAVVGAFVGVLLALMAPIVGTVFCSFLTGYLILQTMAGLIHGNFYSMAYLSPIILVGGMFVGVALSVMLPIVLITRSVILGSICIFYATNAIFRGQLDYPLRHSIRRLLVENYRYVYADTSLDENDYVALASFVLTMIVCLFLRTRYQSDEVQGDYSRIEIPCHAARHTDDDNDEDRIERSTVIAADDTVAYQRFVNEQTVITRWTSGDDDVFETPRTNSRFFRLLRRTART